MGNTIWRAEPISVEKLLDELRVGVKGQSNLEIARTPRNAFQTPNARRVNPGSEGMGAKVHVLKENNPDRRLRPRNAC